MRTAERPRLSFREHGPQRVFTTLWQNRKLVYRLAKREVASRYRGSLLGFAWSFVTPVLMLAVYTFVFSVVFRVRWEVGVGSRAEFALVLFVGLIVFQLFSECVGRAPGLMLENISYIKKVVFPLEALAWVSMGSALFNALVSSIVLIFAHLILVGLPPITALWLPTVLLPLVPLTMGGIWFLSSVGVFLRDIRQVVGVVLPILMFMSPIFYPVSALPEQMRTLMYLNPLTYIIEQARNVVLFGLMPDFLGLALYLVLALGVAWLGLAWFLLTKRGFADVV
ncbi:MAG: ABC transporter permease [Gammaproteobacteria bacterium]